jgi:hypothetical protein
MQINTGRVGSAEYLIIKVILADQGAILLNADQGTIQQDYCIIHKMLVDHGTMLHIQTRVPFSRMFTIQVMLVG